MSSGSSAEEERGGDLGLSEGLTRRLSAVEMLLMDVDGVLTDGRLYFDAAGRETKVFHVHDGSGLVYWKRKGFVSGFLSGRDSPTVRKRAEELQVDEVHLGGLDKVRILETILTRRGLDAERVLYMGDDFLDIPVLKRVGVPVTVPEARPEVKEVCCYVTRASAGAGAVRETVELMLRAKGLFSSIVAESGRLKEGEL